MIRSYSCADGSGSMTMRVTTPIPEHVTGAGGAWTILGGTGRYVSLRGKGRYSSVQTGGDPADLASIAFRSASTGIADLDAEGPQIVIASARAAKLRRPAGMYLVTVRFSARDNVAANLVSYRMAVRAGSADLAFRSGTTTSGTVKLGLRLRPPKRAPSIRIEIVATDPLDNHPAAAPPDQAWPAPSTSQSSAACCRRRGGGRCGCSCAGRRRCRSPSEGAGAGACHDALRRSGGVPWRRRAVEDDGPGPGWRRGRRGRLAAHRGEGGEDVVGGAGGQAGMDADGGEEVGVGPARTAAMAPPAERPAAKTRVGRRRTRGGRRGRPAMMPARRRRGLVAGAEPVPAGEGLARRLLRVGDQAAARLGQHIHAGAGGEVVRVLLAAVQHHHQALEPACGQARDVEAVVAAPAARRSCAPRSGRRPATAAAGAGQAGAAPEPAAGLRGSEARPPRPSGGAGRSPRPSGAAGHQCRRASISAAGRVEALRAAGAERRWRAACPGPGG